MEYRVDMPLDVPADRAWRRLTDLHAWPEWNPTVESLTADVDRPREGADITIKQTGRSAVRYRVDLVEEGHRFRWTNSTAGVRQSADHIVRASGDDGCTVALSFAMDGPLGRVLGALGAAKIRRFVDAEASALRASVR